MALVALFGTIRVPQQPILLDALAAMINQHNFMILILPTANAFVDAARAKL